MELDLGVDVGGDPDLIQAQSGVDLGADPNSVKAQYIGFDLRVDQGGDQDSIHVQLDRSGCRLGGPRRGYDHI